MTTLTFPTLSRPGPTSFVWRKLANTQTFESPLTRSVQTLALPGARWACTATWDNLLDEDARKLAAFMAQLRGASGRFYLHHLARPNIRGTGAGTPLVKGASQTGASLVTDGWTVGTTLLAGDLVGFGGYELRMVVADATADGSGNMTLTLDEPMRASPSDNSAIDITSPAGIFRLTGDEVASSFAPGGPLESFTLDCVETFA